MDWTVVDDGLSRNGTYVNGERIHGRRRLVDGDTPRHRLHGLDLPLATAEVQAGTAIAD